MPKPKDDSARWICLYRYGPLALVVRMQDTQSESASSGVAQLDHDSVSDVGVDRCVLKLKLGQHVLVRFAHRVALS